MLFKVGEKAVYPAHGVAEVTGIEARHVAGCVVDCYILNILTSGATLMVPIAVSDRAGMRQIVSAEETIGIFSILCKEVKISQKAWNRRQKEFNDKIRSGLLLEAAEVYRDLSKLQTMKELSYGEKQMLEKSKELVLTELSVAKNVPVNEVKLEIEGALASA